MTVGELIERLGEVDPDMEVVVHTVSLTARSGQITGEYGVRVVHKSRLLPIVVITATD